MSRPFAPRCPRIAWRSDLSAAEGPTASPAAAVQTPFAASPSQGCREQRTRAAGVACCMAAMHAMFAIGCGDVPGCRAEKTRSCVRTRAPHTVRSAARRSAGPSPGSARSECPWDDAHRPTHPARCAGCRRDPRRAGRVRGPRKLVEATPLESWHGRHACTVSACVVAPAERAATKKRCRRSRPRSHRVGAQAPPLNSRKYLSRRPSHVLGAVANRMHTIASPAPPPRPSAAPCAYRRTEIHSGQQRTGEALPGVAEGAGAVVHHWG